MLKRTKEDYYSLYFKVKNSNLDVERRLAAARALVGHSQFSIVIIAELLQRNLRPKRITPFTKKGAKNFMKEILEQQKEQKSQDIDLKMVEEKAIKACKALQLKVFRREIQHLTQIHCNEKEDIFNKTIKNWQQDIKLKNGLFSLPYLNDFEVLKILLSKTQDSDFYA